MHALLAVQEDDQVADVACALPGAKLLVATSAGYMVCFRGRNAKELQHGPDSHLVGYPANLLYSVWHAHLVGKKTMTQCLV